jgi:Skp family chaperone for outer membrane proteins
MKLMALAGFMCLIGASAAVAKKGHPENKKGFEKHHPRRTQVLKRTDRQKNRVNKDLTGKKMTYQQGSKVKREDRAIRRQEQADAKANGGHITKGEQRQLNREENGVNREIKRDETKDAGQ